MNCVFASCLGLKTSAIERNIDNVLKEARDSIVGTVDKMEESILEKVEELKTDISGVLTNVIQKDLKSEVEEVFNKETSAVVTAIDKTEVVPLLENEESIMIGSVRVDLSESK
jgi:predicted KAP-like P-loop ATPase